MPLLSLEGGSARKLLPIATAATAQTLSPCQRIKADLALTTAKKLQSYTDNPQSTDNKLHHSLHAQSETRLFYFSTWYTPFLQQHQQQQQRSSDVRRTTFHPRFRSPPVKPTNRITYLSRSCYVPMGKHQLTSLNRPA